jgi:hypothetical protein
MATTVSSESRKQQRRTLADDYMNEDLSKQREWYDARASSHKKWANYLSLIVIAFGALTSFVATLKPMNSSLCDVIIAALGVFVVISQGILQIWRYNETWVGYRMASERMLRERRLFINAAGPYADIPDEEESLRYFIEVIEQIVAEEQKIYFKQDHVAFQQENGIQQDSSPPPAESTTEQPQ